jgi:hypothetical protein
MTLSASRMARFRSEMEAEATRGGGDFIKFGYFTPPQNKMIRVRILPGLDPNDPEKDFYVKVYQHYNVSPTKKIPVTCPKSKSATADCPICQRVQALFKYIKARSRFYMSVIPQEGENAGQILIWAAPKQVKDAIIGLFATPDYGDITDLVTGRDVYVTKTGEQLNTAYQVLPTGSVSAMSDNPAEIEALREAQPPLYLLRNSADLDNIRKYMSGETENILQGFATAPKEVAGHEEEQDASVYTQAPAVHVPVAQAPVEAPPAAAPYVAAVSVTPAPAPVVIPAAPVAAAPKKFDLSAIQAQVNKINKK